jgi:histone deacetylase 6
LLSPDTTNDNNDNNDASSFLNDDDYLRVHLPGYMKRLDHWRRGTTCNCLEAEASQFQSIYLTEDSVDAAKRAAASLCHLVQQVVGVATTKNKHKLDHGFAIIRPPGHHAAPGLAGGYCLINNVAVAAAYAKHRFGIQRVLIVDWDVHHGNGTQSIFTNDPNVLYFSVHRHGRQFFPYLESSGPSYIGVAKGSNVNVGWSRKGMGDDEYYAAWHHLLLPMAQEFDPNLILISAGFDAADGDAAGDCHVSPEGFATLTRSLKTISTLKTNNCCGIVAALEGGYVQSILGKCVTSVVQTLLENNNNNEMTTTDDNSSTSISLDDIDPVAATNIRATMAAHKPYWKCFQPPQQQDDEDEDDDDSSSTKSKERTDDE